MDLMLFGSNHYLYVMESEEKAGVVDKPTLDAWIQKQLKAITLMYFGSRRSWPTKTTPDTLMLVRAELHGDIQQIVIEGVEYKPKAGEEVPVK